jgi:type III secretion protein D
VRTVADATKKVSTVVAGDPAYIQTADGARYFAGAMMPSGHRLVAIEGQIVRLEKNGHEVKLSF